MFINECAPISRALVTLIEEKGRFQRQNARKLAAVRRLRVRETRRQHKLSLAFIGRKMAQQHARDIGQDLGSLTFPRLADDGSCQHHLDHALQSSGKIQQKKKKKSSHFTHKTEDAENISIK
jgi:hypothetical protein